MPLASNVNLQNYLELEGLLTHKDNMKYAQAINLQSTIVMLFVKKTPFFFDRLFLNWENNINRYSSPYR